MWSLYLDDIRYPKDSSFVVARSVSEAIQMINDKGFPNYISFDHDLGENEESGYDFAKWIINYDIDYNVIDPTFSYNVHSANPVGAKNINFVLNNYLKFKFNK